MRYMSIYSFRKLNPDWEVILYISDNTTSHKTWNGEPSQDYYQYKRKNYLDNIKDLDIKIEKVEFPIEIRDQIRGMSPIHESCLFRYYQLYKNGGFYSDTDILYFNPIDGLYNEIIENDYDTIIEEYMSPNDRKTHWINIGFLGSSVNNNYYQDLFEFGVHSYTTAKKKYDLDYQSLGAGLIHKMIPSKLPDTIENKINSRYLNLKIYNLPSSLVYNYNWTQVDSCFTKPKKINDFPSISIGYHWFGGSSISQKFNNIFDDKNYTKYSTTFSMIADDVIKIKEIELKKDVLIHENGKPISPNILINNKIPKRMFFYWGGTKLSWMRYMSIYSFIKFNPDWEIILYVSEPISHEISKRKREKDQDYINYNGDDYLCRLTDSTIKIQKAEFPESIEHKLKSSSPIHRSDLFRYYVLYNKGGFYCDTDVIFFRSMDNFYNKIISNNYDTIIHEYHTKEYGWMSTIGFLGSVANNQFFKDLFDLGLNYYNENSYQSIGSMLIYRLFNENKLHNGEKLEGKYYLNYPNLKVYNIPTSLIYQFDYTQINNCFKNSYNSTHFDAEAIGYHWYGGHPTSQQYNNILNDKTYKHYSTTFTSITNEIIPKFINVSFVISYNESNDDRKRNLQTLLNYLQALQRPEIEIIVVDQGKTKHSWLKDIEDKNLIKYIFIYNDGIFNKGWGYNIGAKESIGENIIFNDVDVLLKLESYIKLINSSPKFDVVNPYNDIHFLTNDESNQFIGSNYDFSIIRNKKPIVPSVISGGIFMMNKNKFLEIKGFDENCYGYGHEDDIFDVKINKLQLSYTKINDIAIHLYHITSNGEYYSFKERNKKIFRKYLSMNKTQIFNMINNTKLFGIKSGQIVDNNDILPRISIVMSYYNRRKQAYNTLKSIEQSKFKDFEVILVDDGSSPEHRFEELQDQFPYLRIIRIEPEDKWYTNPCVPFNIGIKEAKGEIIVLQNPECMHVHDVLEYINNNIDDSKYISISAYSLNEKLTDDLYRSIENNNVLDFFRSLRKQVLTDHLIGWYNHSIHRPRYYHFCSAMTKKNMDLLGGFDEIYANGIGFDDDDFVERIKKIGLKLIIEDNVSVIHQWHKPFAYSRPNTVELVNKNKLIFNNRKHQQ